MSDLLEAALAYRMKYNFSVIPVGKDKRPLLKWEMWQKSKPEPDTIRQWWAKHPEANVGIVTGKISGLFVIDCDTPEAKARFNELCPDSLAVPTVRTPRGGDHFYFQDPGKLTIGAGIIPGLDYRGRGGYVVCPPSKNGKGQGYVWLPGLSLDEIVPPPLPSALYNLLFSNSACKGEGAGCRQLSSMSSIVVRMFVKGRRDDDLFHVANCLMKGGMAEQEATQVLEMLAKSCDPPFSLKDAHEKIESALKRGERRDRNLTEEVKEWILSSPGVFLSSEIVKSLQLSSREEQKNLSKVLSRFCDGVEKLIERHSDKRGCFRRIETECQEIDFLSASSEPVQLHWPFRIEDHARILPKNVIVVAGEPNSGKTAFLLNVAALNMDSFDIYFFSSETGPLELRDRLSKFDIPLSKWKKVHFFERSSNFSDVIVPDAVNVIDFLEVHDEFYKMGAWIKAIYDRLEKGIAIIGIQKRPGQDWGRGGIGTIEKARLAVAMEAGKIRFVKVKNWSDPILNPNGMEVSFKLVNGCKFITIGNWGKPGDLLPGPYRETAKQHEYAKKRVGKDGLTKEFKSMFPD